VHQKNLVSESVQVDIVFQSLNDVGEIRCQRMNKAFKPVKRANLNTGVPTREKALNVGTGNEVGRAAVTATIPSAQIAYQLYRLAIDCCRLYVRVQRSGILA
jgi:hypothetical protein